MFNINKLRLLARYILIKILPANILVQIQKTRNALRRKFIDTYDSPPGTDWVGYETLIDFILERALLDIEGDIVEIGTFLGGGAYKLSRFLRKMQCEKLIYVVDIFDPSSDLTKHVGGKTCAEFYEEALKQYKGKSQLEIFLDVTKNCENIVMVRGDTKEIDIPADKISFAFIDGCHDSDYVENDFYLIWNKLEKGGAIGFHDYEADFPKLTSRIKANIDRHTTEIQDTLHNKKKHILFIIKK